MLVNPLADWLVARHVCFPTRLPVKSSSQTACWQGDRAPSLRPEQEPGRGRMLASDTPVTDFVREKHWKNKRVQQWKTGSWTVTGQLWKTTLKQSAVCAISIPAIRCIIEMKTCKSQWLRGLANKTAEKSHPISASDLTNCKETRLSVQGCLHTHNTNTA